METNQEIKKQFNDIINSVKNVPLAEPGDENFIKLADIGINDLDAFKIEVPFKMKTSPDHQKQILNANAEIIIELIINGWSFQKIANKFKVAASTFYAWKKESEYSSVIEMATEESAEKFAYMSVSVLTEKAGEKEIADVTRRKALSQALQWLASKRNKSKFGKNDTSTNINVNVGKVDDDKSFNDLLSMVVKKNQSQQQIPNNNRISDAEYSE